MLQIVRCLGGMHGSHDQLNANHQLIAYSLIWGLNIDIGNILFSDLIAKLLNSKKKHRENHWFKVPLTSHMNNVAKKFANAEPLIPPSGEVNADKASDKSSSGTVVQSLTQPKAKLEKKKKKKQNPPPSQPNSSTLGRQTRSKSTVNETQSVKDLMATADSTQSLETSKSAEEVVNHPDTIVIKKEPKLIMVDDAEIVSLGSSRVNEVMEDVFSDPESIPDDEIMSVYGDVDNDSDKRLKHVSRDKPPRVQALAAMKLFPSIPTSSSSSELRKTLHKNVRGKMCEDVDLHCQSVKHLMQLIKYIEQIMHSTVKIPTHLLPEIMISNNLSSIVNETSTDMTELVDMISHLVRNMDTSPPPLSVASEGEKLHKGNKRTSIALPSDDSKMKMIMPLMEQGCSTLNFYVLKRFRTLDDPLLTIEEATQIMKEKKIFADIKPATKKSEKALKRLTPAQRMAQEKEFKELEARRKKLMDRTRAEHFDFIKKRDENLPITKFKYHINKSSKKATMTITRNYQPVSYKVYTDFKLKAIGFNEWLELHALASKKIRTHNTQLLKRLQAKFKWATDTTDKLKIPPPR
ncbi:hypothetical protein Tco_0799330 [Tanacetum coccineum]|uniref:Uncharacterized protein n=1 Tax=Tanacetum coccineum TaxID=301880 RepID=A0ABQ4ZTB2_9ASTR